MEGAFAELYLLNNCFQIEHLLGTKRNISTHLPIAFDKMPGQSFECQLKDWRCAGFSFS
jgi:hypothetical protein